MRKVNLGLQLAGICILTVSTAQAVIYCPSTGTASSTDWLDQDLNITCQVFQSASLYSISLPASATYYAPYNGSGISMHFYYSIHVYSCGKHKCCVLYQC